MSIVCLVLHMHTIMKISVLKAVIEWEQGPIVNLFFTSIWYRHHTQSFCWCTRYVSTTLTCCLLWHQEVNFVSFTSCILIWFITISSVQKEFLCVNNIKLVLSIFKDMFILHVQPIFISAIEQIWWRNICQNFDKIHQTRVISTSLTHCRY